jgi:hypothetical protein
MAGLRPRSRRLARAPQARQVPDRPGATRQSACTVHGPTAPRLSLPRRPAWFARAGQALTFPQVLLSARRGRHFERVGIGGAREEGRLEGMDPARRFE